MNERALEKIADLLSLNALGVFELNAIGVHAMLTPRNLWRTLPRYQRLTWEREPTINVVPLRSGAAEEERRAPSGILWARTDSGAAIAKLRQFRPLPDVVIREGGNVKHVAFWALEDELHPYQVEDANKRLAKYLNGGGYATADAGFRFYLPGTILRVGRHQEIPINLVHWEPAVHKLEDVVGRLPDPPDEDTKRALREAALERKAAAERRVAAEKRAELERAAAIGSEK